MKFHWGYGAGMLYLSFVAFMLFLVYQTTTVDFSLVTKDYYKDEIEYQQKIDKKNNSASLGEKLDIEFHYADNKARFRFPNATSNAGGEILFYRPSDSKMDLRIPVQPDAENIQEVSYASLQKGLWRVQVDWNAGGIEYYDEKPLIIQ